MTFQQKNTTVSLASFSLILVLFLFRMTQLIRNDNFTQDKVIQLWIIVIVLAVFATIAALIVTHGIATAVEVARTGDPEAEIDQLIDERDKYIDLEGTRVTYTITSFGSLIAMLTFALGQSPLVMFSLLIFSGVIAQIAGDVTRLRRYNQG